MKNNSIKLINNISWIALAAVILISLPLLFGLNSMQAAWDGTASASFYTGNGTQSNPYIIKNEKNMGYFIDALNAGVAFEGKYVSLDADLDMRGYTWEYVSAKFSGTFTGNAHTVKTDCMIFPNIGQNGVITGVCAEADATVSRAILCDYNSGLIQMCIVRGNTYDEANSATAGMICVSNSGTVQYCGAVGDTFANGIETDPAAYAAMVAKNSGTVQGCFSALTVRADGSRKYRMSYENPIANSGSGYKDNYYNAELYTLTVTTGKGLTTAEMQSAAFLNIMASNVIPGYQWITGSDGYPTVDTCGTATVSIAGAEGDTTVFHTASTSCRPEKFAGEKMSAVSDER